MMAPLCLGDRPTTSCLTRSEQALLSPALSMLFHNKETHTSTYLVHIIEDSLTSSDQIRAVQSPTVRKILGYMGFLVRA